MKNVKNNAKKKGAGAAAIVFPLLTLICLAGFIGSLIFPNRVLDTYVMNMDEEEGDREVLLPLSYETPLLYMVDTQGKPMQGVQLGISKRGQTQEGQLLSYSVSAGGTKVSDNVYRISDGDDIQYVFLPFENPQSCVGNIEISFLLTRDSEVKADTLPAEQRAAMTANSKPVNGTKTVIGGDTLPVATDTGKAVQIDDPSLKGSHIYSHDTYPFLYDARLLTFIFLAVSMTVSFRKRREAV